jgi:pyridinium-3,5-biscarboxylic acid mononucleotide synthase
VNEPELKTMLDSLISGEININQAVLRLKNTLLRTSQLDYAQPDHHRELRHGLNEVIYGQNKSIEQITQIAMQLSEHQRCVLITRLNSEKISILKNFFPQGRVNEMANTFMIHSPDILPVDFEKKFVAIVSGGTSDINVAEEASEVCVAMKIPVQRVYDVGVAGLHRIIGSMEIIQKAKVVIVVAGMEGALPSVVGGLIAAPVIAVPTSIGYGASFQGLAALLGMLNSCSPGVVVTNIDAGFSAGFAAARIIKGESYENALS